MLGLAIYAVPALCALLPNWLAVALVPTLLAFQRLVIVEEDLVKVGPATVYPLDILTALLLAKVLLSVKLPLRPVQRRGIHLAVGAWLLVNLAASLLAGLKFGDEHAIGCLVAWGRCLAEVTLALIMAHSIHSLRQARAAIVVLMSFLVLLVAIQFVNFLGAGQGMAIGEVQGLERGEPRYFGPVGDSVGFVLLLGYLYWLCRMNLVGIAAFAGGILLTAGLGAVLSLAVATGLFVLARLGRSTFGKGLAQGLPRADPVQQGLQFLALAIMVIATFRYAEPMTETLRERLSGQAEESGEQRLATAQVAMAMINDNCFFGVGFMGFRLVVNRYGGEDFFDPDKPDGATANANNQVLQSLTDAGIVGLLSFAALILTAARLFHRVARQTSDFPIRIFFWAALLWLLAQVFGNLVASWLTPSSFVALLLWISVGLALGIERLRPEAPGGGRP